MKNVPFPALYQAVRLLRIGVAIIFLAHAGYRLFRAGSMQEFAAFLDNKGLVYGKAIVALITLYEIAGGIALALGFFVKWLAALFIVLLLAGIAIIHLRLGWFVGEHGTGGCEYSFILIMALLTVASAENEKHIPGHKTGSG
jgi:putative oxidoreductase